MASKRYLTDRYVDFQYDDEASTSDPLGRWTGAYYARTYRCRIPKGLAKLDEKIHEWIERHADQDIWLCPQKRS